MFELSFVYGNPTFANRRHLWNKLLNLRPSNDGPWCCMGDFNEMNFVAEKDGLREVAPIKINLFRDFLNSNNLMGMELHECKCTWLSNPRDCVVTREMIDRVLANWSWRNIFPHALAMALPIVNSDHSPIILKPKPPLTSGRSLKYVALCEDNENCKNVIAEGWNGKDSEPWDQWNNRVNSCKTHLIRWHMATFKNDATQIGKYKVRLQELLNRYHSQVVWAIVTELRKKIDTLWKQEEQYWGQRSRIKWIKWGDKNSKLFHANSKT